MNDEFEKLIKEKFNSEEMQKINQIRNLLFKPNKFYQLVYYKNKHSKTICNIFLFAKIFKHNNLFKTKEDCNSYYKAWNKSRIKAFNLIEQTLDEVLLKMWNSNKWFTEMTNIKDIKFGDKNEFIGNAASWTTDIENLK